MNKKKNSGTVLTVLQGFLLLVILSTMFSIMINLILGSIVELSNTKTENPQAVELSLPDQEDTAPEGIDAEKILTEIGSVQPLAVGMYASLAALFLIKALSSYETWKPGLIRYGVGFLLFVACTGLFLFTPHGNAYALASVFHAAALGVDHILSMVKHHKARNVIFRLVCILLIGIVEIVLLSLGDQFAFIYILAITIPRIFFYISQIAFSQVKINALRKILKKTFAPEILFGLLLLIIAFSIVLPALETGISDFWDALWYCFAIVTTIGFGDFTASSALGRIISVILGIYGIIVVALITSIIVNFYNETKDTGDAEETAQEDASGE